VLQRREFPGFARVNTVTSASLGYPLSVFNKNFTLKDNKPERERERERERDRERQSGKEHDREKEYWRDRETKRESKKSRASTPATASKVEKRVIEERDRDGERTKKRQTEEGASK